MSHRLRIALLLVFAGTAGFMLGACGGGSSATSTVTSTRTIDTGTRTTATAERTLPARTQDAQTTTEESSVQPPPADTTPPEPPPPPPPPPPSTTTVTETETQTQTETQVQTQTETRTVPTVPTTTQEAEPASSDSSTPWGWIVLGLALALALLSGLVLWRRRRSGAAAWSARLSDLSRRTLVTMDDVLRDGSLVTGRVQALTAEAQALEARAPDETAAQDAARLRARLDELAATLEADRTLRLGSPPPSQEQLTYSTALIRQQVDQLQGVLRPPPTTGEPR